MTRYFDPKSYAATGLDKVAIEGLRQTQKSADTFAVPATVTFKSDAAGVFPAGNPSVDLIVTFVDHGVTVATNTITGTLDSTLGTISAISTGSSGGSTVVNYFGNDTDSVRAEVTHSETRAISSASFIALDQSAAGITPTIVAGGGGYEGGGGGGGGPEAVC